MPADRTLTAVCCQIKAMGVNHFEVGIFSTKAEKMLPRRYTTAALIHSVGFLKHHNYHSSHIYIRPEGSQGLILVDDLSINELNRMERDGILLACIIETSPFNYQAWLKVSHSPIDPALATGIAQVVAKRYHADYNSADYRHYGRLAGFTNRKPEHVNEQGIFPYVRVQEAIGVISPNADELINAGHAWLNEKKAKQLATFTLPDGMKPSKGSIEFFNDQLNSLLTKAQTNPQLTTVTHRRVKIDYSKIDWMVGVKMAQSGYSKTDIIGALIQCSPDIATRKLGHVEDYVHRTANSIFRRMI